MPFCRIDGKLERSPCKSLHTQSQAPSLATPRSQPAVSRRPKTATSTHGSIHAVSTRRVAPSFPRALIPCLNGISRPGSVTRT
ncbi:hypothetical protein CJF31_00006400 [Rutstroemia sp. NJR-2017a BVV2]|nr:hypothetical protein CJF31_00006400 [Rutstroemia sp. NJR-2017a BVV2]